MDAQESNPIEVVKRWDTWEILGAPFLDTEHDKEWKEAFKTELKRRGITGFSLLWRQVITAGGLWWNILWWEWAILGGKDIVLGWAFNFALVLPIIIGMMFGWISGIVTLVIWLIVMRPLLRLFFKAARVRDV